MTPETSQLVLYILLASLALAPWCLVALVVWRLSARASVSAELRDPGLERLRGELADARRVLGEATLRRESRDTDRPAEPGFPSDDLHSRRPRGFDTGV